MATSSTSTNPSINLRELRDTRQLKLWLKAGVTVELRERDRVLGHIVPEEPMVKPPVVWPDFEARRKAIFGDRVLEGNAVLEAREDSRY